MYPAQLGMATGRVQGGFRALQVQGGFRALRSGVGLKLYGAGRVEVTIFKTNAGRGGLRV